MNTMYQFLSRGLFALGLTLALFLNLALANTDALPRYYIANPEVLNGNVGDRVDLEIHLENIAGLNATGGNFQISFDPSVIHLSDGLTSRQNSVFTGVTFEISYTSDLSRDLERMEISFATRISNAASQDGLIMSIGGYLVGEGDPRIELGRSAIEANFPLMSAVTDENYEAEFPDAYTGNVDSGTAFTLTLGSVDDVQNAAVTIPLEISDLTNRGVVGFDFRINYDPEYISFDSTDFLDDSESILPGNFMLDSSVDAVNGVIHIYGAQSTALAGSGNLLILKARLENKIGSSSLTMPYKKGPNGSALSFEVGYVVTGGSITIKSANPVLEVTPVTPISFTDVASTSTITVKNDGTGNMNWTATASQSWLSATPASGTLGEGQSVQVVVSASANNSNTDRDAELAITASGASGSPVAIEVAQEAGKPVPAMAQTLTVPSAGGTTTLLVGNSGTGTFTYVVSDVSADWLSVTAGQTGTAGQSVTLSAQGNPVAESRSATFLVTTTAMDATPVLVTLTQSGAAFEITGLDPEQGTQGETVEVQITGSGFAAGLTMFDFGAGIDVEVETVAEDGETAALIISIAANATTGKRDVTAMNGDESTSLSQAFTVLSRISGEIIVAPDFAEIGNAAQEVSFQISVPSPASRWIAASEQSWITILNPENTGSGTLRVRIEAGSGSEARSGIIKIFADDASNSPAEIHIHQSRAHSLLVLQNENEQLGLQGGEVEFRFTISSGNPAWRVRSNQTWAQIVSSLSGSGNGIVRVRVAENTQGVRREAQILIEAEGTDPASVTARIVQTAGSMEAPVAHDDEYEVYIGQVLTVNAPGVLVNDRFPAGVTELIAALEQPSSDAIGYIAVAENGSLEYRQNTNRAGRSVFTYRAVNPNGGAASEPAQIRITVLPETPVHGSGTPGEVENMRINSSLSWKPVAHAHTYNLEFWRDTPTASMNAPVRVEGITNTYFALPDSLVSNVVYAWRVQAVANGIEGYFTTEAKFRILDIPAAVSLLTPENNAVGVTLRPVFTWQPVDGATSYKFELATNEQMLNAVLSVEGITETTYTPAMELVGGPVYYWRVTAFGPGGTGMYRDVFRFTRMAATSLQEDDEIPHTFEILSNYPNPFNPTTTLRFRLPASAEVKVSVYDVHGRLLMQVPAGSFQAGQHQFILDASQLGSGMYMYRIDAGTYSGTGKMTLIK